MTQFFWQRFLLTLPLDVNPQTGDPYADCTGFLVFPPTFLSRSQLISLASNRSLCRICNTNHLSTSIAVPKFPGCALYSIDLLFLLASRLAINILSVVESFIQYLLFVFLSHRKKRSILTRIFVQYGDMLENEKN